MRKHCVKKHNGDNQEFEMKVVDYVRGDPTKRQIMEAVRINNIQETKRINNKKEWVNSEWTATSLISKGKQSFFAHKRDYSSIE